MKLRLSAAVVLLAASTVAHATGPDDLLGTWYYYGNASLPCYIGLVDHGAQGVFMTFTNPQDQTVEGILQDDFTVVAGPMSDSVGQLSGDPRTDGAISWSSGVYWTRTPEAPAVGAQAQRWAAVVPSDAAVWRSSRTAVSGPLGAAAVSRQSGAFTRADGATVQYGSVRGAAVGLNGAAVGAARGVRVTSPTGQTYTRTDRAGAAVGPGGRVVAGRSSSATVAGPFGAVGVRRSGVAVGY
jgi:hypothetical protein